MSVAAAEQISSPLRLIEQAEVEAAEVLLVIDVARLESEQFSASQAARFAGSLATSEAVQAVPGADSYSTYDALQRAAEGDRDARAMLKINVKTDGIERTLKSGHVTEVRLQRDEQGRFVQHGQNSDATQANTLRHGSRRPQMRARIMAETRNKFRLENAAREGLLKDYYFVTFSRAADDMSEADMEGEGFFTDTMSMAIQATAESADDEYLLESAFVAGRRSSSSQRHDADTVETFYGQADIDIRGMSATELLDRPLLIHKSLMPNGVVDIVERLDDIAGTFFGRDEPRQDYLSYRQKCAEREATFEPRVETAVRRLIAEAPQIHTPEQASQRLGKISAEEMIEQAVVDPTIDSAVFGAPAAFRIEHARYLYEQGDIEQAHLLATQAKLLETSRSCPGGVTAANQTQNQNGREPERGESNAESQIKDCEFVSKKCPICGEKDAKTLVRNGKYYHVGKGCKA